MPPEPAVARRSLLRFLLASPLWLAARPGDAIEWLTAELAAADPALPEAAALIERARDALHVFEFEPVAQRNLSPAHWAYLSQGVHDEFTLRANREGFGRFQLRPRRLVDVRDIDTSLELLGTKLSTPIVIAPCGSQKAFHPEGELAVARAARRKDHLQILSAGTSTRMQEVAAARGAPIWFQLYTSRVWLGTRMQLSEAEDTGCPVVVLTVDTFPGVQGNRDRVNAFRRADNPDCHACHGGMARAERWARSAVRAGEAVGLDLADPILDLMVLDWDYVDRIRDGTSMKLFIKGITTREDAALCLEHGVDGIVVSTHGGRADDIGMGAIEALPEVVEAVAGRIPVLVDSGFRRGPDFFKALALGAQAVCVGRPYLWGLAAFGQEGVEAVLAILRDELEAAMKQMGTPSLADITPEHVRVKPAG